MPHGLGEIVHQSSHDAVMLFGSGVCLLGSSVLHPQQRHQVVRGRSMLCALMRLRSLPTRITAVGYLIPAPHPLFAPAKRSSAHTTFLFGKMRFSVDWSTVGDPTFIGHDLFRLRIRFRTFFHVCAKYELNTPDIRHFF